jgi:hypothetical protein
MYEKLLRDLQHGVEFTSKASTTPNPTKLNALLEYILLNTSKLPALCIALEKKVQSTLPRRGLFGSFRSARDILLHTTLPKIRECEFYINILRAVVSKCKALGILCKVSEVIIRIIELLLQQSHEEYLKLFYQISLDLFDCKESIDYSSLVTPIINLCGADMSTSWSLVDRQNHGLQALSCLIKCCISQPGALELSFDNIFNIIVENLDINSFYEQSSAIGNHGGSLDVHRSDLSLACFDRLAAAPSLSSLIALLNTMVSYFDHYGWSHGDIIIELFVRFDLVALQHRHYLPTISHLIAHANYIATSELAENISQAERVQHPRYSRARSTTASDLSQPSPTAALYVESILQITTAVIEREAHAVIELTNKDPGQAKLLTYTDTNKCFYYLTHILWMCIVWKSFQINSTGKSQAHDIVLSAIEYNASIPALQLSPPFDSDEYSLDDSESNRNAMIDILKLVWECIYFLSKYRFPKDETKFQAIPSLFQVLQEKVQGLVTAPGVRLDLLIPAKNAMFIFVLHAISIVLAENVLLLTAINDDCLTTLTGDMTCELALLLRSRSWQTQRLSITVLYQLFYVHKQQLGNRTKNDFNIENMDAWSPYDDRLICVLRDGIFNALCTQYSHQAHSVVALFKLQTVMLGAFGDDELLAIIPMIIALEEFWSIFSSIRQNANMSSSSSATSTSTAMSSLHAAESHESPSEMLRCQRWYFLAFFFHISKVYAIKELQKLVIQLVTAWGKKNALSRYLALDSVNALLIIDHAAADATNTAKPDNGNAHETIIERINREELVEILLQCPRLINSIPASSIQEAFSAVYHPQEDPFTKLQDLHAETNISKSLFPDDLHSVDDT